MRRQGENCYPLAAAAPVAMREAARRTFHNAEAASSTRNSPPTCRMVAVPEAATFADALDGLGAGLFIVDAAGRILHANVSGHALLQERAVLRAANGRLIAC